MSSFSRTPSFSSDHDWNRLYSGSNPYASGGMSSRGRVSAEGPDGGQFGAGAASGSYTTQRGGTVNYGAAGYGARGPGGAAAGRGVYGVSGTTAGGRSFTDVGRAGGAVGPGGNAVGGRENLGAVSGPRGTAVGSREGFAAGSGGVIAGGSRAGVAAGRGSIGAAAYRPYGRDPYGAYHAGWVHGYWSGHDNAAWGWRNAGWGGWGLGAGLGWGLASWGYGSSLYGMGYLPYVNPYYLAGAGPSYNYSQPIDTQSTPPAEDVAGPATALFDAARQSFLEGAYDQALQQTNDALAQLPNDATIHEFRALCLFALGRYDESAASLYAVLSVGPGWDWTTLIGLYPDIATYTAQLRALEAYCHAHLDSAPARFVLAYQYLAGGHAEAAVDVLKRVVQLMPSDTLSAKLLKQLAPPESVPVASAPVSAPDEATPTEATPPPGASIAGAWNARPAADTAIDLTVRPDGAFTWKAVQKGQPRQFAGSSTYGDGVLTLVQDQGPVLAGRVTWQDASHFNFRLAGDPSDPGLSFSR